MGSVAKRLARNRTREEQTIEKTYDRIGGAVMECRARGSSEEDLVVALLGLAGALAVDTKETTEQDFATMATNAYVAAVRSSKEEPEEEDDEDDDGN